MVRCSVCGVCVSVCGGVGWGPEGIGRCVASVTSAQPHPPPNLPDPGEVLLLLCLQALLEQRLQLALVEQVWQEENACEGRCALVVQG